MILLNHLKGGDTLRHAIVQRAVPSSRVVLLITVFRSIMVAH
jgi:hypothetical protein